MEKNSEQNSEQNSGNDSRGKFLIAMIVVYVLLLVLRFVSLIDTSLFKSLYSDGPSITYTLNVTAFLLETAGLIAISLWKKWGIAIIILVTILFIIFDSVAVDPKPSVVTHIITLIPLFLLIWAVARKWQRFTWK